MIKNGNLTDNNKYDIILNVGNRSLMGIYFHKMYLLKQDISRKRIPTHIISY